MSKVSINDADLNGKRVLIRTDFDVPIENGVITSSRKIEAALPTIRHALNHGASVVLISHLGRPDGRRVERFSLAPVAEKLQEYLGRPVRFLNDCVGPDVEAACRASQPGEIILLENLRFYLAEEGSGIDADGMKVRAKPADVAAFRASLSQLAEIFVNDAFNLSHRNHSSIVAITLPRIAGLLFQKEIQYLGDAINHPQQPLLAIIGGRKPADKMQIIDQLLNRVDEMIICGGLAFTFMNVMHNVRIGNSIYDQKAAQLIPSLLDKARNRGVKLHFPVDHVISDALKEDAKREVSQASNGIPDGFMGVDIGPDTIQAFTGVIAKARTILWHGPAGAVEIPEFSAGTCALAEAIAKATDHGAITIIGDDGMANVVERFGIDARVSHVFSGGAAMEMLEGKTLPGVTALPDKV